FGSARACSPEDAEELVRGINARIENEGRTPELDEAMRRAEYTVKLANYYSHAQDLARRITEWSKGLTGERHFIVCSGGSYGMMEAANRGASSAHGKTIGLNIHLPHEQEINRYVSRELVFNFHYFFMRKFWFVYPAKALVVFPGGFGTMDELFEVLTLIQTKMPDKPLPVVLFGTEFWDEVLNFEALVRWGVVSADDLSIFYKTDSVDDAFAYLTTRLEQLYLTPRGLDKMKLT
ncbi:MAG TPA: LOG family protein, partial [Blastocatellia bacterium]|nr:LOG family protein [Blastocatellia bacterium]